MKEGRLLFAVSIFLVTMALGCQALQPQKAIDYNNKIVDMQSDVIRSMLALGKSFDSLDEMKMKSSLEDFQKAADQAEEGLNQMTQMEDDEGLKHAALELLGFYKVMGSEHMTRMVEILCQSEITDADVSELGEISSSIEKTEAVLDENFSNAQDRFAVKHGFSISENVLQEQVDSM